MPNSREEHVPKKKFPRVTLLIHMKPLQDAILTKTIKESGEEQLEEISNFLKDVPNMK